MPDLQKLKMMLQLLIPCISYLKPLPPTCCFCPVVIKDALQMPPQHR